MSVCVCVGGSPNVYVVEVARCFWGTPPKIFLKTARQNQKASSKPCS